MDVPVEKITALQQFHWIERDFDARTLREGVVINPYSVASTKGATPTGRGRAKASQGEEITG